MNHRLPARPDRVFSGVLAVVVFCATLTACSIDPDSAKKEYFARAEQYFIRADEVCANAGVDRDSLVELPFLS